MIRLQCYIAMTLFVLLGFKTEAKEIEFLQISFDEALKLSAQENKPIFIDFYTEWCGPCKKMSSHVFTNDQLSNIVDQDYIAIQLDAESSFNQKAVEEFKISSYPTIIFVNPNIDYQKKLIGFQSAERLIEEATGFKKPITQKLYQMQKRYEGGELESSFILSYINELKRNKLDFISVAMRFLESNHFDPQKESDLKILLLANSDFDSSEIKQFLNEMQRTNKLHQEIFMQLSMKIYDQAFRSRNRTKLNLFIDSYHSMFESITEVKMNSHDIIDYLGAHHRFKI